jgi:hypothetical protein
MVFRTVNSGVEKLVAWVDTNLVNSEASPEQLRVYMERSFKECSFFGKSICIRARIEDSTGEKVYARVNFSLYPRIPSMIKIYEEARTLDILEKVSLALHDKGVRYDYSLDIK